MAKLNAAQKADLFEQYVFDRFCRLERSDETGSEKITAEKIKPLLSAQKRDQIQLIEDAAEGFYAINRDCDDDQYIADTMQKLEKILPMFKADEPRGYTIRNTILNRLYDLSEQAKPLAFDERFNYLKTMVMDVKTNDGSFDYDPLYTTAKRLHYSIKNVSAKQKLSLLLKVERKTVDHNRYDISLWKESAHRAYMNEIYDQKQEQVWGNQLRFHQIQTQDLPAAQSVEEKINLYQELKGLVNDQDWSRGRKFNEKKTICNHLIELYTQTGNEAGRKAECVERQRYIDAASRCKEAARKRGYFIKSY